MSKLITKEMIDKFRIYIIVHKQRIAFDMRAKNINDTGYLENMRKVFKKAEKELEKDIKKTLSENPLYQNFFARIKGVGFSTAAKIIYYIRDIERFPNVAKLWRYAGFAVMDGKAEKRERGKVARYNPEFKGTLYYLGIMLLRGSKYRRIYLQAKEYYTKNRDWTKKHVHFAALRKMIKLFLAHLWEKWRELEGLPTRVPYAVEYLNHTTILKPEDFFDNSASRCAPISMRTNRW